jgi:hypothetical protein
MPPVDPANRLERSSELRASAEEVWAAATDPDGINYEMRPLARMTMPRRLRGRTLEDFPVGTPAGRCWVLLFGVLPVDYDDLCVMELEPPRRFLERSEMAALSVWEHERTVEPLPGGGCRVTDRLGFEPRPLLRKIPGSARLVHLIAGGFFTHRHRRLRRRDAGR